MLKKKHLIGTTAGIGIALVLKKIGPRKVSAKRKSAGAVKRQQREAI